MFMRYLKEGKVKFLVFSAVLAAAATYVRPVNYFLGAGMGFFLLYLFIRTKQKKLILPAFIFLIVVYSLIGIWHVRNYRVAGRNTFTTWTDFGSTYRKFYARKDDVITRGLPPIPYYLNAVSRCVVSLMTEPGTLKDFNRGTLKRIEKILGYLWVAFWMVGFLVSIFRMRNNLYLQFLLYIIGFFVCVSIAGILFAVGYRLRVPMVACLAVLSAHGWMRIAAGIKAAKQAAPST